MNNLSYITLTNIYDMLVSQINELKSYKDYPQMDNTILEILQTDLQRIKNALSIQKVKLIKEFLK